MGQPRSSGEELREIVQKQPLELHSFVVGMIENIDYPLKQASSGDWGRGGFSQLSS